MKKLKALLNHIVSNTSGFSIHLAERRTATVLWVVDADDECLACSIDNDTLGCFAFFLTASLAIRWATFLVVDLTASESISVGE